jgi:hypothetical protein
MGEGVGIGEALGLLAAPDIAFPESEPPIGPKLRPTKITVASA